ncbi:MAG: histidine kinase, partial [Actinomycetota bacterium]|nr:histidine kinase [Actinomycetota bacterium]
AVTFAFRPLRARIQTHVDRRFNRARYEALHGVDAFLRDLRTGTAEPEQVGPVLANALREPSLRLFFWLPDRNAHADATGGIVSNLPPGDQIPVRRGDLRLATVVHDRGPGGASGTLSEIIARAGMAIEIARLRVEVRRQLAEVEESRARIVTATHEERRRLERDLHDGAQQRLVAIGLDLRHLQAGMNSGDTARQGLDGAVEGLTAAIAELRELAGGVRPATLDAGLASALTELANRAPIPTRVHATPGRFPDEVEAAAYFVASEALTNAVKHADANVVTVRATRENGALELSIEDDGCGGASPTRGSGLTGLADRVAAVGGRMDVESPSGLGTKLVVEFPCG